MRYGSDSTRAECLAVQDAHRKRIEAETPRPIPTDLGVVVATGYARGYGNALARTTSVRKVYRFKAQL
jgi:hypothetical protein